MTEKSAIWSLAFGQTLFWAGLYYIFPALIVRWEVDFGWSKSELTAGLTLALLTSGFMAPLVGRFIDKGHGAIVMTGGGMVGGLLVGLLGFMSSLPVFYALSIGLGACMACCLYEPCFSFLLRNKGIAAQRSITIITLVAGLAGTVTFPVSHFVSDLVGWRVAIFFFVFLVCGIGVPLMWFGAKAIERHAVADLDPDGPAKPEIGHRYGFLLQVKFWLLALAFMLYFMNNGAITNHFLLLLKERQIDADLAITVMTFMGPMRVLARFAMMVLDRYISSAVGAIISFVVVGAATASLMGAVKFPQLLFVFMVLQGGGVGIMTIMKPMVSRSILGAENYGLKAGIQATIYMTGTAFSGLIASLIWEIGGYDLVLICLLAATMLGMVLFMIALGLSKEKTLE